MTEWLKGCEVCNAGLCARFDELIEAGEGQREAARQLEEEQQEKLGEVVYSSSSLLNRYHRNKPEAFRNGTPQQSGGENTGEEWPKCSKCYRNRVEKNQRTGKPNDNALCKSCRRRVAQYLELQKKQEEFDQTPIDEEAEHYWSELTENFQNMLDEIDPGKIAKITPETYSLWSNVVYSMTHYRNKLDEKSTASIKIN